MKYEFIGGQVSYSVIIWEQICRCISCLHLLVTLLMILPFIK